MSNIVQKLRTKRERNFINDFDGSFRPISQLFINDSPDLDASIVFLDDSVPLVYGDFTINLPLSDGDDLYCDVFAYSSDRGVYKVARYWASEEKENQYQLQGHIVSHIVSNGFNFNEAYNDSYPTVYVDGYSLGNYYDFDINEILYPQSADDSIIIHLRDNSLNSLVGVNMDYTVTINGVDYNTDNGIIELPNYVLNSNLSCTTSLDKPRTINGNIHGIPASDPQVLTSSNFDTILYYTVAPLK